MLTLRTVGDRLLSPTYGSDMDLLSEVELGVDGAITFSTIPQTYSVLHLYIVGGGVRAGNFEMQLNGDTTSNYSWVHLRGRSSTIWLEVPTETHINLGPVRESSGGLSSTVHATIPSYSNDSIQKTVFVESGNFETNSTVYASSGQWRGTNAINSIRISTFFDLSAGTVATLYGIK